MPDNAADGKAKVLEQITAQKDGKAQKNLKPVEVKDLDEVTKPSPVPAKPTPAVDPDADSPDDGLATKMAKAKRRKAKNSGQIEALKDKP